MFFIILADSRLWSLLLSWCTVKCWGAFMPKRPYALIISRSQAQTFPFVIHWFFNPPSNHICPSSLFLPSPFFLFAPPPLLLASGVPVLLIRPYQWSNLAATAWVSVARRAAPLSCPAVAEINPQIEQSPCWPLQTPKSCCVHPSNRDSLLPQALFFRVGVDGVGGHWGTSSRREKADECVCMSESVWGQGGLSEREMDRGEGLRWLTEPVYISNGTLLWEGGRGGKSALQAKHSSVHFSVSFRLLEKACCVPHSLTFLPATRNMIYLPLK